MPTPERVALVTGAGTGIGRAAALALLGDGWRVVLAGRRPEPLASVAAAAPAPEHALVAPADVADPESVRALFARTRAAFGRLDVLFNNAGTGAPAVPLEDLPYDAWRRVLDVNLTGMFLCTQEAFRIMRQQDPRGGRIINNGSLAAHAPRPHSAAYTATKHGVSGLTRSTALDGRRHDIVCSQIDIGNARTDLTARMAEGALQADGRIAPEPLFDVEHAGRAVAYIASLPLEVNVLFMNLMAAKMPFVGRG